MTSTALPAPTAAAARRAHYAAFFGEADLPDAYGLVVGNCQAESLRIVLDAPDRATVRVPPVHELTAPEVERLHEILPGAAFLVAQPVRDDYHGLPLGTRQLAAATAPRARVVTFPVIRFAGLHPFQATLRVPGVDATPPIVDYHDVRTLAAERGMAVRERLDARGVHAIARDSLAELQRREQSIDVRVSDLLEPVAVGGMRTVNHPGNAVWMPLGERVLGALGLDGAPTDPGRPLLNAVHAPLEDWVLDAWALDDEPRPTWIVDGRTIDPEEVVEAHRRWYGERPAFVDAALERVARMLDVWRI